MRHQILIEGEKCIGCGLCVKTCAAHNIELRQGRAAVVSDACILCGQCSAICPKGAVSITGYEGEGPVEKRGEARLAPQEVLDVIRFRRTIRQFKDQEIPRGVVGQILEAGRLTHTAKNTQDVSFVVLERERGRLEGMAVRIFRLLKPVANLLSPMARRNPIDDAFFFFGAPTAIVVLAKNRENGLLAAQNMEFVAEANGLGVLFSGFFTMAANLSPKMRRAMGVPRGKKVAMTLVLGYPAVKFPRAPARKALDVKYM